jgi:hypothetical protein
MRRHSRARLALTALAVGSLVALVGAQAQAPGSWVARSPKLGAVPFQSVDGHISFEYPKKDWVATAGVGPTLAMLVEKNAAAWMVVERTKLQMALAPDDVTDLFSQLEADRLKEAEPQATGVQNKLFVLDDRRFTAVQLSRKGLRGTDVVRQYSFPVGEYLYRLVCGTTSDQFPKFEPIFAHAAATFRAQAAAAAAAAPAPAAKP